MALLAIVNEIVVPEIKKLGCLLLDSLCKCGSTLFNLFYSRKQDTLRKESLKKKELAFLVVSFGSC